MIKYFNIFWLLLSLSLRAQKIEMLKKADSAFKIIDPSGEFLLIDSICISPEIKFVATWRAGNKMSFGPMTDLSVMKAKIEDVAKKLGANSYRVKEYVLDDSLKYVSLTLDTYFCSEQILKDQEDRMVTNVLYIIPDLNWYYKKPFHFKFNKQKISLNYREYYICRLEPGDEVKITKGLVSKIISVHGGMPAILLSYVPYTLMVNNTGQFNETSKNIDMTFLFTFFIHPRTCTGCTIPPAASPCTSCPQ